MDDAPETRYAKTADGVHIAYQVVGDGPIDLIEVVNGTNFSIDAASEQPRWQSYLERLRSFSRLIQFDRRGIGLSDPLSVSAPTTMEQWASDALTVLDTAGSDQAAVMAVAQGGAAAILLAATHPGRIRALVLVNAFARILRAADYPAGVPSDVWEHYATSLVEPGGEGEGDDDAPLMAPSLATDPAFRAWWRRAGHRGASPTVARLTFEAVRDADVRSLLPVIHVPTLILWGRDNSYIRASHGRYLAENIPGARSVELPTADHLPWTGDVDYAGEIEEFLTGVRRAVKVNRVLTTIVFTDIVGSTERASGVGDRVWKERLDRHDEMSERQVRRFGGRVVKTTGDGALATFDGPAQAIQAAIAIRDAVGQLGIELRVGVHTGEVELRGDDIGGIAVHIGARVMELAKAGEVLVSRTVTDLVTGSGIEFDDRGEYKLKGVAGTWKLFAVEG